MSSKNLYTRHLCVVLCLLCLVLQGCITPLDIGQENSDPLTTTTAPSTTTTVSTTKKTTTTRKSSSTPRATTTKMTTTGMPPSNLKDIVLNVPIIAQFPGFPTGCESVSAVMVLNYYNEPITVSNFINQHLTKKNNFWRKDGVLYGPDPYKYFIGNPTTSNSYGCMAPVIEKALISYFGSNTRVKNTTGTSLPDLCTKYIDQGSPVLVWATIGMIKTEPGQSWKLEDGSTFTWPTNEHCMVLIGYDDNRYYFNDPYRGTVKSYQKSLCELRYKDLGMQSIAVTP